MRKACGNKVLVLGMCKFFYTLSPEVVFTTAYKVLSFARTILRVLPVAIPSIKASFQSVFKDFFRTIPNTNNNVLLINNLVINGVLV